jgi:CheY-like chemotaxis protein
VPSEFRILIVEDNSADEQLFKATLSPLSLSIDVAKDGREGYQKLKENSYDLMILDLIIPT